MSRELAILTPRDAQSTAESIFRALFGGMRIQFYNDIDRIPAGRKIVTFFTVTGPRVSEEWAYHFTRDVLQELKRRGDFMVVIGRYMMGNVDDYLESDMFGSASAVWLPFSDQYAGMVDKNLHDVQLVVQMISTFLHQAAPRADSPPPLWTPSTPKPQSPSPKLWTPEPAPPSTPRKTWTPPKAWSPPPPSPPRVDRYSEGMRDGRLEQVRATLAMLRMQHEDINTKIRQMVQLERELEGRN